ncbi:MAG: hypothetical protein IT428_33540 [Planctomycetaceae bacterium]|nr:hypothetical protein [Planctomycetaceae bacterium]
MHTSRAYPTRLRRFGRTFTFTFIGNVEAGYRASILMTIVSTAHRHHLDVRCYLKDVLDRLLQGERDLDALRADRWAQAHPEALRPHRIEEARYRADAKADRRAIEQQRSSDQQPALRPDRDRQRTCLWWVLTADLLLGPGAVAREGVRPLPSEGD